MANATANVQLNVTGNAQQQLQKIQKSVSTLQSSFGSLRNALGGVAFGAFFTNVLRSADAIDDLSKATGLSIAVIDGFGNALQKSGGDATDAANLLGKFSQSLEELKEGSLESEYTLDQLGLTIEQLRGLSDEDALRTIIESLGKMPAGAERTALAMKLLGKNAKSIDWTNLNGSLEQFINKAKQAEPGTKALADLYDNLQGIGRSFTNQLTIGGKNFAETLAKLTENTDAIAKSLVDLTRIVTILGTAFTVFTKILPGIKLVKDGIAGIASIGAFTKLSKDLEFFSKNWQRFTGQLPSNFKSIQSLGFALGNLGIFFTRLGGYGLVLYGLGEAFKALTGTINPVAVALKVLRDAAVIALHGVKITIDTITDAFGALFDLLKIKPALKALADSIVTFFAPPINWLKTELQNLGTYWKGWVAEAEKALGIADELPKGPLIIKGEGAQAMPFNFKEERKNRQTEYEKLKKSIENTTQAFIDQRNAQLRSLALQVQSVAMTQKEIDVFNARQDVYDSFTQQIEDYQNKISELKPEQEKLIPVYLAEIETLEKLRTEYMDLAEAAVIATDLQIQAQKDLQSQLQRTFAEIQKTVALEDLRAELDLLGLQGDELERQQKIMAIQREMRDDILSTVQKLVELEQQLSQGIVDPRDYARQRAELEQQLDIARQIAEGKLAIDEEYYKRKAELENDYMKGVEKALEDIAEQYKPINVAQDAIKKGWDKISDAVDSYVETGKFKFSDFARSVIIDLGKMIAKAMIFKAISAALGAFGLKIPGLASGGPAKAGQPYIVGEKGPELFVPQNSGKVIPNNQLDKGMNAGAISAPVTNNYTTYNINALDAKSVAQLFAENRKAIFGANKMAEREMSYAGAR
jgi:lambda family phage tail tape measure protein